MHKPDLKASQNAVAQASNTNLAHDLPYKDGFYNGDIVAGIPEGKGTFTSSTLMYTGDFVKGQMNGKGTIEDFNTGIIYTGDVKSGAITGFGKYKFVDGSEYEGTFENGRFNGDGQFTL